MSSFAAGPVLSGVHGAGIEVSGRSMAAYITAGQHFSLSAVQQERRPTLHPSHVSLWLRPEAVPEDASLD